MICDWRWVIGDIRRQQVDSSSHLKLPMTEAR
jgi:hypothetical protein